MGVCDCEYPYFTMKPKQLQRRSQFNLILKCQWLNDLLLQVKELERSWNLKYDYLLCFGPFFIHHSSATYLHKHYLQLLRNIQDVLSLDRFFHTRIGTMLGTKKSRKDKIQYIFFPIICLKDWHELSKWYQTSEEWRWDAPNFSNGCIKIADSFSR